eukprot:TRINITY_DN1517_c0_g1_i1.p1 TRINITY_DN1517_c0_g1~~TRINITY_DN1517_c0_g1_i1.p1  ORF type:complete len:158 (-),score=29.64 TRINITY_DN1517_c0_g1_i1:243-716(-)
MCIRDSLYTTVNDILAETHGFASSLAKYNKEVDQLITAHQHKVFLQRWNVFTFKLEKAGLYLSLHNFEHALYYLRSLRHDMQALRGILHDAGKSLHSQMSCKQIFDNVNSKTPKLALCLVVAGCFILFICCMHAGDKYKQQLFRERVIRPQVSLAKG